MLNYNDEVCTANTIQLFNLYQYNQIHPQLYIKGMNMASSRFQSVERAPADVVFNILAKYKEDTDPNKVNLSVGG